MEIKAAIEAVDESSPSKCAWCSGSGQMFRSPGAFVSCIVCGGKGEVLIGLPAESCSDCAGTGKKDPTLECFKCRGYGWTPIVEK